MALATAIVCLTVLARMCTRPFIPTELSKAIPFPRALNKLHLGFRSLKEQPKVLCQFIIFQESAFRLILSDVVEGHCEEETVGWQHTKASILPYRIDTDQFWLHVDACIEQLGINQITYLSKSKYWFIFPSKMFKSVYLNVGLVFLCGTRECQAWKGGFFAGTDVHLERVTHFGCHNSNHIVSSGWNILSLNERQEIISKKRTVWKVMRYPFMVTVYPVGDGRRTLPQHTGLGNQNIFAVFS